MSASHPASQPAGEERDLPLEPLVRMDIGSQVWLVPQSLLEPVFISAVRKLQTTRSGDVVPWTKEERGAYWRVLCHPNVWRPL